MEIPVSTQSNINKDLILLKTLKHEIVFDQQTALSHINTNDLVEISVVTEGNGVHSVLNQTDDCSKGDMFITGSGVPHGFFAKEENEENMMWFLNNFPFRLESIDEFIENYCN